MARLHIDLAKVRNSLPVRREPYWGAPIDRGLFLGFRKLDIGGNWIARWRSDEGKQLYRSLGPLSEAMDYEAARKAAVAWKRAAASGVNTDDVRTVADACREYVKNRRKDKGDDNAHDSDMRFKRTVYERPIGHVELMKLTERRVEEWRDQLIAKKPGGHGLSKASANRTMTTLKAALNFAARKRYVTADRVIEWENVSRFEHATNRRELYLDLDQRRALLGAAKGAVRDLIEGIMHTGARPGELTQLKRAQFSGNILSIIKGKTGPRDVLLNPSAIAFFTRLAKNKFPGAFLFTRDDGKPWGHSDWDDLVRDAAKAAKLPEGVCLYTLRHSFITDALDGGVTTLRVAKNVGTSLLMIEQHYGQRADKAAAAQLARITFV